MKVFLKCGHFANATDNEGNPACAIHAGITDTSVADKQPDLTGRKAKCTYKLGRSGKEDHAPVESSPDLAFFQYKPGEIFDEYYCGCWGWD